MCSQTHSDWALLWCITYIFRLAKYSLSRCLFSPPCRLLCNVHLPPHPDLLLCNQILPLRVFSVFVREVSFCTAPTAAAAALTSADCLLWARHWPLQDHMFLSCHQPKDKPRAAAALFGTKRRSACSGEICLICSYRVWGLNIDCSVHTCSQQFPASIINPLLWLLSKSHSTLVSICSLLTWMDMRGHIKKKLKVMG